MANDGSAPRLYSDLAWLWPTLSPVEDYIEEAEFIKGLIATFSERPVELLLELGCGGGHIAHHLSRKYRMTACDISSAMLELSRKINPDVEHIRGDMRSLRLDRQFDAVLIYDSINYMLTEADLRAALTTAWEHLRPGGMLATVIEAETGRLEDFSPGPHTRERDGLRLTYTETIADTDPSDTTYEALFTYEMEQEGVVRRESDRHIMGIFAREVWMRTLISIGFDVSIVPMPHSDFRPGITVPFVVAVKPISLEGGL